MTTPRIQIPKQPEDVEQVRAWLQRQIADGKSDVLVEQVLKVLEQMRQLNTALELRNAELLRKLYGQRSEKIDPDQLALFYGLLTGLAPAPTQDPAAAEHEQNAPTTEPSAQPADAPAGQAPGATPRPKKKHPGRRPLPASLPREPIPLTPPPEQLTCPQHGPKVLIRVQVSEVLEFVPSSFKVLRYEQQIYGCSEGCEGQLVTAEPANKIIERGLPGPGLMADMLVKKYRFGLPLERIRIMYQRGGVELSSSTMGSWVTAAADLLEPIAKLLAQIVLQAHVLGTDDTGLPVLDRDHPNGIKRGHMWAYVSDGGYIYYEFTPDWSSEKPREFLSRRTGIIQADDYAGYAALFGPESGRIKAGCWAHYLDRWIILSMHSDAPLARAIEPGAAPDNGDPPGRFCAVALFGAAWVRASTGSGWSLSGTRADARATPSRSMSTGRAATSGTARRRAFRQSLASRVTTSRSTLEWRFPFADDVDVELGPSRRRHFPLPLTRCGVHLGLSAIGFLPGVLRRSSLRWRRSCAHSLSIACAITASRHRPLRVMRKSPRSSSLRFAHAIGAWQRFASWMLTTS